MQHMQNEGRLIRNAENLKIFGGGPGKGGVLSPGDSGKVRRRPHFFAVDIRKPITEKIVMQRRVVLRGEIVQSDLVGMAKIVQPGGLPQIPETEKVVP